MKKLITGLIVMGIAMAMLVMPLIASADYSSEQCERCCHLYNVTKYYRVSYFDESHEWVTDNVEAWTAREAAEDLGLRAGYDCVVGYNGTEFEPMLKWYRVSHFDSDHNWITEYVEAVSREDAVSQLGLEGGYFVGRAFGHEIDS